MSFDAPAPRPRRGFQHFFLRGLGIVLPTALTFWLIAIAYQFVKETIAAPINTGLQAVVLHTTPFPTVEITDLDETFDQLPATLKDQWNARSESLAGTASYKLEARQQWMLATPDALNLARREAMRRWWQSRRIGSWQYLDLIGVVIAIVLIYFVGVLLTSYLGRRLYARGEEMVNRVPLIRRVYPSIKQVTDFFFPGDQKAPQFSRVVAVEYPRKGIWSLGLVTGATMHRIQDKAGRLCMTVFIPSSPTPFTGYVITIPVEETVDLPVSIEDALKFVVSGGVVVPRGQMLPDLPPTPPDTKIN